MTKSRYLAALFSERKAKLVSITADMMLETIGQTCVSDQEFAEAVRIACDPVCDLDVPFILGHLLQSNTYEKAVEEIERWIEGLVPPSQDVRKDVLERLSLELINSLCE